MRQILLYAALAAAPAFWGCASAAPAQTTVVDEGRFIITSGGQRVGKEDFAIRRQASPGGDVIVARATVALDERRLSPLLRTDSAGVPLQYEIEVRAGSQVRERLSGQAGGGRFSARVLTPSGESAKEYIISDGARVLDDDVFHHYWFLRHAVPGGTVPVVIPRRNVQVVMRVVASGDEALTIGGRRVRARHLVVSAPGEAQREVWLDGEGRVLEVKLGASGFVATRDELPR
jgi:hypothetical protein